MKQSTRRLRANLLLLLTALIWGLAFVAQDVAMDSLPPYTFNGLRMALAGLALMPCIALLRRREARQAAQSENAQQLPKNMPLRTMSADGRRMLLAGGCLCGVALFMGAGLQQVGIQYTSPGKAGFISALYIVLVPLVGLFIGKRVRLHVWLAVGIALAGLFLLCVTEQLTIEVGELYLVASALCFAGHILVVDHFASRVDCLRMSCLQFFVASVLCFGVAAITETPTWQGVRGALIPILYAGVLSGAVGYTLQIIAQRDTAPTIASLLMCLESVFAVLFGWLILGDVLTPRELLGCAVMLAGIVLAQVPVGREKKAAALCEAEK